MIPRSLANGYQNFGGEYCLHLQVPISKPRRLIFNSWYEIFCDTSYQTTTQSCGRVETATSKSVVSEDMTQADMGEKKMSLHLESLKSLTF
jgi:hypothetical protein